MLFALIALGASWDRIIIPYPNKVTETTDRWELTRTSAIGYNPANPACESIANFVAGMLRKVTGFPLNVVNSQPPAGIYFDFLGSMETEEYSMKMTRSLVTIVGGSRTGMLYGFQSLRHLMPPEIYLETPQSVKWTAPCVNVEDKPRFGYRGVMVDPARRWLNISEIRGIVDRMSRLKLNHLHMHISDDQGWRIEIKRFPLLTEIGSYREASPTRWDETGDDGTPYGPYFYTEEELRDLVKYARDLGVTLVPEIESPGHSLAALAGYPQYSCTGGPFKPNRHWRIQDNLFCAGNDGTFQFLQELIDEVLDIFNDTKYIHVGGDEAPKTQWEKCPKCQQRKQNLSLKSWEELQVWFVKQLSDYCQSKKGVQVIEWDDYCDAGVPNGTVVMAWLKPGSRIANKGHPVIQASAGALYFPRYQYTAFDGYEYTTALRSLKNAYHFDPTNGVDANHTKYVLGVEGPMWGEHLWNISEFDWKYFPRGWAMAEIGWTQPKNLNWPRFLASVARTKIDDAHKVGVNSATLTINPCGEWNQGEIPSDHYVTVQWHVKGDFEDKCVLEAAFIWLEGTNALKVKNVKLVVDGQVIDQDNHEGRSFDKTDDSCFYTLTSRNSIKGAKHVNLIADVMGDGGSDTRGHVYLYATYLP